MRQQRVQVGAVDVAHHEVQPAVLLARGVDRDHVRVVDRRRHARLALEALAEGGVGGAVVGDQLDRDRPPEAELGRAVDDAHPARPGDGLDPAAGELGPAWKVGHPSIVTDARRAIVTPRPG